MNIRRATPDDSPALARVQVESYRTAYAGILPDAYLARFTWEDQAADWQELLSANPDSLLWVAEDRLGHVCGYALARVGVIVGGGRSFDSELVALHVDQTTQGQGVGRRLVATVARELRLSGCRSLMVWVLEQNPARTFYERLGGQLAGQQVAELGEDVAAVEVAYVWSSITLLENRAAGDPDDRGP